MTHLSSSNTACFYSTVMFFVFLTVSSFVFDYSSGVQYELVCYGKSVRLPDLCTPPFYTGPLYFTPSNGGPRKLMVDKGKVLDPRLKVYLSKVYLSDLTEGDEGTFAATFDGLGGNRLMDILKLEILDCAKEISKFYGKTLEYDVPGLADFLEFTPIHSLDHPIILWNRTDPQASDGKRGRVRENVLTISQLTQADNGYYNFRRKDHALESRIHLKVEEQFDYYHGGSSLLFIKYPQTGGPWTVTFKPQDQESETVMEVGNLVPEDNWFSGRIYARENGIEINFLDSRDSGTFAFRDPQGNLALSYALDITTEPDYQTASLVFFLANAYLMISICCCLCCIKRCYKKSFTQTSAAPATSSHDVNLPIDPRPSYTQYSSVLPHQAVNSAVSKGLISSSFEPLHGISVKRCSHIDEQTSTLVVPPPADQGSAPAPSSSSDLSSDADLRFELKGLSFLSAPPLDSDTPPSDVYASDKLNFM